MFKKKKENNETNKRNGLFLKIKAKAIFVVIHVLKYILMSMMSDDDDNVVIIHAFKNL